MQTFLPYRDFTSSIDCLDNKRLGKQRVEALQIINVLDGKSTGWINHPAVKMWRGYRLSLAAYHDLAIAAWVKRGFNNSMLYILDTKDFCEGLRIKPPWLTREFCAAHRSNLLRKDPEWYGRFGWTEPDDLPYIWPVKEEN